MSFGRFIQRLRWALTPSPLPVMGRNCTIHPSAEFRGDVKSIKLGDDVTIDAHAFIHCDKKGSIEIGSRSYIGCYSMLHTGKKSGRIRMGSDCSVQAFSLLYGTGGLEIGNQVRMASHTLILPVNHVFEDPDVPIMQQGVTREGITIGDDVWLAAGVRLLDGCRIGTGCVIGAGSIVGGSIADYSVAVGSPARAIKSRRKTDHMPVV